MTYIRHKLNYLLNRKGFLGNILTLISGATIAQSISICAAPILSRLYDPKDFGTVAVYSALLGVFSVVVCWRYEIAIVLPEKDEDAFSLLVACIGIATFMSIIAFFIVTIYRESVASFFSIPQLSFCLLFLPFGLLISGIYQPLNYWNTRKKFFKRLVFSKISQSVSTVCLQITAGIFLISSLKVFGLLITGLIGQCIATSILLWDLLKGKWAEPSRFKKSNIVKELKTYKDLPQNAIQSSFLNSLSTQLLPLIISYFFSSGTTGLVVFAYRMISMPARIIVNSTWQVTHAQLGIMNFSEKLLLFRKVHKFVSFFYAFPLIALAVLSSFSVKIFGETWHDLQYIIPAFSLMIYINSVSNSTSYFAAFGYYKAESIVNILLVLVRILALVGASQYFTNEYTVINFYALASVAVYLGINSFWGLKFKKFGEFMKNIAISLIFSTLLLSPIKLLLTHSLIWSLLFTTILAVAYYLVVWRFFKFDYGENLSVNK